MVRQVFLPVFLEVVLMFRTTQIWARSAILLLPLVLTLGACERLDPTPDGTVVLQAQGHFYGEDYDAHASMIIRANPIGFDVEVVEKDSNRSLLQALIPNDKRMLNRKEWFRGPLELNWRNSGFTVAQSGDLTFKALEIQGIKVYKVTHGELAFHGSRYLRYSAGHLDRDVKAQLRLQLFHKDGTPAGRFEGVSNFPPSPALAGTEMVVGLTGSTDLGAGTEAKLTMSMLRGAGSLDFLNQRHPFNFDKRHDIFPPGGAGQMVKVEADEYHVEVKDQFSAKVRIPSIKLKDGMMGSGEVDVNFDSRLEVDSDKIIITGSAGMHGYFHTPGDGYHSVQFSGKKPLALELEW